MTQKERFEELYNSIISSRSNKSMKVLGCVTKKVMNSIIESHPQIAEEMLNILESVNWDNYLTEKEADSLIQGMKPEPRWSRQQWKTMMVTIDEPLEKSPYYNKCALYITMCMIDSDSGPTLKKLVETDLDYFKLVYNLAIDKLTDKDKIFNIRHYFCDFL